MVSLGYLVLIVALSNAFAQKIDSSVSSPQQAVSPSTPGTNSFTSAFANGFTMVGATELGDKVCDKLCILTNDPLSSSNTTSHFLFLHDRHFG